MLSAESNWTVFKRRLLQLSATEVIVDRRHNRPLLHQKRRHRLEYSSDMIDRGESWKVDIMVADIEEL